MKFDITIQQRTAILGAVTAYFVSVLHVKDNTHVNEAISTLVGYFAGVAYDYVAYNVKKSVKRVFEPVEASEDE